MAGRWGSFKVRDKTETRGACLLLCLVLPPAWPPLKGTCGLRSSKKTGFPSSCLLHLSLDRIQMALNTHPSGIDRYNVMSGNLNITKIYL